MSLTIQLHYLDPFMHVTETSHIRIRINRQKLEQKFIDFTYTLNFKSLFSMKRKITQRIRLNTHSPSLNPIEMHDDLLDNTSTHELFTKSKHHKKSIRDRLSNCLRCGARDKISKQERIITFDGSGNCEIVPNDDKYPPNTVNNQKYSLFSFIPMFLFDQFKQFGNAYFLIIALTQLPIHGSPFESMWVGVWWTHIAPLVFVLCIAFMREAYDQFSRYIQDKEINDQLFTQIIAGRNTKQIKSSQIEVGDLIILEENQRVPCDMILLWCSSPSNTTFIRTDQLDGETDWKLRKPIQCIQSRFTHDANAEELIDIRGSLKVDAPHQKIYEFLGTFTSFMNGKASSMSEGLNLENTLWSTTVIASGVVVGVAAYTGKETRAAMNANEAKYKIGRLDQELNFYSKVLFFGLVMLSLTLSFARGLHASWYIYFGRFIILLSAIIPISLRVHMDLAKLYFSWSIQRDDAIPDTIMRTTTIPEELGRIDYLFSDKTGTLTKNEMVFKKLQLQPPLLYEKDNLDILRKNVRYGFESYGRRLTQCSVTANGESAPDYLLKASTSDSSVWSDLTSRTVHTQKCKRRVSSITQIVDIMEGLALCHNVTPIVSRDSMDDIVHIDYQASSPDEIALVKFTEECGVTLISRDDKKIELRIEMDDNEYEYFVYEILQIFPFTSESRRMGIIVRSEDQIILFAKGAESVMKSKLDQSEAEWMDEEVENLAREGLRTLVFSKKILTQEVYEDFEERYHAASVAMTTNRSELMESIRERLEQDMTLIGVSGVEDKLQDEVQETLEVLRNAHIRVWMLTGDKVETAQVIARSSKLVAFGQEFYSLIVKNGREAQHKLDLLGGLMANAAIVIDGKSLDIYLKYCHKEFIEYAVEASVVICCRCSPTQKAEMVQLVQKHTSKVCAAIGDGGNDVAMIQKANVGIGILGKEGQQASLAADVSINKFEYISRLLLWHGRLSYKNTAKMAQFIMHRGAIIALVQCLFSTIFYLSAVPLFTGIVAVGYTCAYTVAPTAALVLDRDVSSFVASFYPELYHDLQKGRSLNEKTMLCWFMRSVFQAGIIMLFSMLLFDGEFHNIMTISFTALVVTELFNIVIEVKNWHCLMVVAECGSIILYFASIYIPHPAIQNFFDITFVSSSKFWARSLFTGLVSVLPMALVKIISKNVNPAAHAKLKDNYKGNRIY
eukprot:68771_1